MLNAKNVQKGPSGTGIFFCFLGLVPVLAELGKVALFYPTVRKISSPHCILLSILGNRDLYSIKKWMGEKEESVKIICKIEKLKYVEYFGLHDFLVKRELTQQLDHCITAYLIYLSQPQNFLCFFFLSKYNYMYMYLQFWKSTDEFLKHSAVVLFTFY